MSDFYNYLIGAGIAEIPASWCCVFLVVILTAGVVTLICKLLAPRR